MNIVTIYYIQDFKKKTFIRIAVLFFLLVSNVCSGINMYKMPNSEEIIETIKSDKILFAHQSVGQNIIDGISILSKQNNWGLNIKKNEEINNGGIYHVMIGENEKPYLKISEFKRVVEKNSNNLDIAIFKFCYVDVDEETNVEKLFNAYVDLVNEIEKKYPQIKLIKTTIPIRVINNSFTAKAKRFLGLNVWGDKAAYNRENYNNLVRKKYGKDDLFDIALIESSFKNKSNKVSTPYGYLFSMDEAISSDGSHLNQVGKLYIANELLNLISEIRK